MTQVSSSPAIGAGAASKWPQRAGAATQTAREGQVKDIMVVLGRVKPLSALSVAQIRDLACAMKVEDFEQDQIISTVGEPSNYFSVVASGLVVTTCLSPAGKAMTTFYGPDSVFGELLVDERLQGRHEARARFDTQVFKASEDSFLRLCHSHPALAVAFAKIATLRWKQSAQDLEDLLFLNAHDRMLKLLARLCRGMKDSNNKLSGRGPLLQFSQGELARFIGITRERVNVVLQSLERDEVIKIRRGAVRLNCENLEGALVARGLAEQGVFV